MIPKRKRRPRQDFELVAHCFRCGRLKAPSEIPKRFFRRWVICPNDKGGEKFHHAAVVRTGAGQWWLAIEQFLLNYEFRWAIKEWFGWAIEEWFGRSKVLERLERLPVYLTVITVVFALVLVGSWSTPPIGWRALYGLFAAYFIADVLLVNTSVAFVSRFPLNPLRSVCLIVVNIAQITLGFATLFVVLGHKFEPFCKETGNGFKLEGPLTALYYSFMTLTNLGVDQVTNSATYLASQMLVGAEAFVGLYFIAIVLATIAGWLNDAPHEFERIRLEDIQPDSTHWRL